MNKLQSTEKRRKRRRAGIVSYMEAGLSLSTMLLASRLEMLTPNPVIILSLFRGVVAVTSLCVSVFYSLSIMGLTLTPGGTL
jgi:hypothetical protein